MYCKPSIVKTFTEDEILGDDRVAFADFANQVVPGWTHYGTWKNHSAW